MRILLAVPRWPWPPRQGDRLRAQQTLSVLSAEHEVTLLAPEPGRGDEPPPAGLAGRFHLETYPSRPSPAAAAAAVLSGWPLQSALYARAGLGRRLCELAPDTDLVILELVRLAPHLRDVGDTPVVVDLIDSLALNVGRRAVFDRPWLRPALAVERRRLERAERRVLERAAGAVVVCERDRQAILGRGAAELGGRLSVVPLAVAPRAARTVAGEREKGRPTVALTGNLGYFVNRDAALWWLREVWPRLRHARPELRLLVAGARPGRAVRRAVAGAGGELAASPPDLPGLLARATVSVAPMRAGSGVPVKVLEAWAAGVPVVASPWAAAGAGAEGGESLLVAETPEEWAEAVGSLLDDPALGARLAAAGRERVAAEHSPERVAAAWRRVLATL